MINNSARRKNSFIMYVMLYTNVLLQIFYKKETFYSHTIHKTINYIIEMKKTKQ